MKRRRLSLDLRVFPRAMVYLMMIGCLLLVGTPSREVAATAPMSWKAISFGPGNDVGASSASVMSVALGNLDDDGDLDIVSGTGHGYGFEVTAWKNDGTPFTDLWNQNDVGASTGDVNSVSLGDLDNDGDLDIVSGTYGGDDYLIAWKNDGTPFTDPWPQNDVGDVHALSSLEFTTTIARKAISSSHSGWQTITPCWRV